VPLRAATAAAFLLALLWAGWGVAEKPIGSGFVDPIGRIAAQDEAVYSHAALEMVRSGDWLTPRMMGRIATYKPPLLYWLQAAAAKLAGPGPFTLRLPSLLAGAGIAALVFWWTLRQSGWWQAAAAFLLVAGNPLWFRVSRLALTDALLVFFATAAAILVLRGRLESAGAATGFALLTKSIAGLPAGCLLLAGRFTTRQLAMAVGAGAAIALPWFILQYVLHPNWFWAEHIRSEILRYGLGSPPQTTSGSTLGFYAGRLIQLDPVIPLLFLGSLAAFKRIPRPVWVWIAVTLVTCVAYQYRNASYLLPLTPAIALMAVAWKERPAKILTLILTAAVAVKTAVPDQPWSISHAEPAWPLAAALGDHCAQGRTNELIVTGLDDEFHTTVLPLARLRYLLIQPRTEYSRDILDFEHLGISMRIDEFLAPEQWDQVYGPRLRAMDTPSLDPLATVLLADSRQDLERLILASPGRDFLVPNRLLPASSPHQVVPAGPAHSFLLARQTGPRRQVSWPCRM